MKLNRSLVLGIALTLLMLALNRAATAESVRPTEFAAGVGLSSSNVYRGMKRYPGLTLSPSIQATFPFGKNSNFIGEALQIVPLQGEQDNLDSWEFRTSAGYQFHAGAIDLIIGGILDHFASDTAPDAGNTGEITVAIEMDAVLSPRFFLAQDVYSTTARYFEIEMSHEIYADYYDDSVSIRPIFRAGYGYDNDNDVYAEDGLNHYVFGVSSRYKMAQRWQFEGNVDYNSGDDIRVKSFGWFGVRVTRSF